MSFETERTRAIRLEHEAEEQAHRWLRELVVAELSDTLDHHTDSYGTGRCDCGYTEPDPNVGIGMHQLEAAADAIIDRFGLQPHDHEAAS